MKTNKTMGLSPLIGTGALCVLLAGCQWSVGGKKGGSTVIEPTKGQQLIDLQKAHQSGAIDDGEYDKLKGEVVGH